MDEGTGAQDCSITLINKPALVTLAPVTSMAGSWRSLGSYCRMRCWRLLSGLRIGPVLRCLCGFCYGAELHLIPTPHLPSRVVSVSNPLSPLLNLVLTPRHKRRLVTLQPRASVDSGLTDFEVCSTAFTRNVHAWR